MEETYAWFSRSSERQRTYTELFISITGGKENPLKICVLAKLDGYRLNQLSLGHWTNGLF